MIRRWDKKGNALSGGGFVTNRTTTRQVMRTTEVSAGEVLVTTEIRHPTRGSLVCPAAALVAAFVAGEGRAVRFGPATAGEDGDAILFVTSYVGRDGVAVGLGAAAHAQDEAGVARAESAVAAWSESLRTRRILRSSVDPLCPGARRAARIASHRRSTRSLYVYGDLPGRQGPGHVQVRSLDEVPSGATIMFPAHGVSASVRSRAAARGLRVIDATCPLAQAAQAAVRGFAEEGDTVLILGRQGHAAVEGLRGQAPGRVILVQSAGDLPSDESVDRASFVLQPGVPVEELMPLAGIVRDRFGARGLHPGKWCYAASDRADALRALARASDVLFILGSPGCADAAALARMVPAAEVHVIDDISQIQPGWVSAAATVGLAESISAPDGMADRIIAALSGLGPLSVVQRNLRTVADTVAPARAEFIRTASGPKRRR
jgi:4-hydroxy-3-methylbut-2-enyl diphosphate reductase